MVSLFLRIAATLALLQFLGHTFLISAYAPRHGPEEASVLETMQSHHFVFQGFSRSYWDFYVGYALFAAVNCLIEALLLWQLARLMTVNANLRCGSIISIFLLANIVYLVLSWKFFFVTPMVFDSAIAVCLAGALFAIH